MKRLLVPLVLMLIVFVAVRAIPDYMADRLGADYTPFNANLEGAKILQYRNEVGQDDGTAYNFLMAGTSRTMADFSPDIMAEAYEAKCSTDIKVTGSNLGNLANYYVDFEVMMPDLPKHNTLVLEFSPHMLLGGTAETKDRHNFKYFREYRRILSEWEYRFTGWMQKAISFEERFVLNPRMMRALYGHWVTGDVTGERVFMTNRMNSGYGQILQPDGQIYYYSYVPDQTVGETMRKRRSEYESYENDVLAKPYSPNAFAAFKRIVQSDWKVIVVRPPVTDTLYELENKMAAAEVAKVELFLADTNTPYIDMNPGPWFATDMSHIDWYDTKGLSVALGEAIYDQVGVHQENCNP